MIHFGRRAASRPDAGWDLRFYIEKPFVLKGLGPKQRFLNMSLENNIIWRVDGGGMRIDTFWPSGRFAARRWVEFKVLQRKPINFHEFRLQVKDHTTVSYTHLTLPTILRV